MGEEKLIKSIKNKGDKLAANELIKIYYTSIYKYVLLQINDKDFSFDLTQEIFISMLKGIGSYDSRKATFKTWLYKIASNKIIDYYRSKYYKYTRKVLDIENYEVEDLSSFENKFFIKEDIKEMLNIVNTFESNLQQIFRLKIFADMTFKQISSLLDISESTVKTRYYTILKKLRKEWEGSKNER